MANDGVINENINVAISLMAISININNENISCGGVMTNAMAKAS